MSRATTELAPLPHLHIYPPGTCLGCGGTVIEWSSFTRRGQPNGPRAWCLDCGEVERIQWASLEIRGFAQGYLPPREALMLKIVKQGLARGMLEDPQRKPHPGDRLLFDLAYPGS